MPKMKTMACLALPLLFAGLFAACTEPRETMTESRTVDLDGATRAEVRLRMGAGELRLRGADQPALLEASFEFNRERLRPEVDYRVIGEKGVLEVRHGRRRGFNFGRTRNRWDLSLGTSLPLDLDVDLGAGRSDLDLRGLQLQRLEVNMGVGRTPRTSGSRSTGGLAAASWRYLPKSGSGSRSTAGSARSTSTASRKRAGLTSTTPMAGAPSPSMWISTPASAAST